jgi:hypothetical protein
MKTLIQRLLRENLIFENENENKFILLPISDDGYNEEIEDNELDEYELSDRAHKIANENGLNILSDKTLSSVLVDIENRIAIGGVWVSNSNDSFSFDIALDKNYQNLRLSHLLIDSALEEYQIQNDQHLEMTNKKLPMNIDVINPKLADILKRKYGFRTKKKIDTDRAIMGRK